MCCLQRLGERLGSHIKGGMLQFSYTYRVGGTLSVMRMRISLDMEESWFEQTAICIKGEQPCLDQGGYLRVSSHSWLTVILICILSIHVLFPFFLRRREAKRWATPRRSYQSVARLTHRSFTLTFKPIVNLKLQVNLTSPTTCLRSVGGTWSTRREAVQTWGEHPKTTQKGDSNPGPCCCQPPCHNALWM